MAQKTRLKLQESHYKSIKTHIDSTPHVEVCGLIGGMWQPYDKLAASHAVVAIPNIDPDPEMRFLMEPHQQVKTMLAFESAGWELIGVYHSHPQGPARPSPTDIAEAYYPDVVYLIGIPGGSLAAWRIVKGDVARVEMDIVA